MKLLKKHFQKPKNLLDEPNAGVSIDIKTEYIRNVFYEKEFAEYVGGTLAFVVNIDGLDNEKLIFCNFNDKEATEDYLFWLSACHLKYKSKGSNYENAIDIIKNYHDQTFVAKILLGAI